MLKNSRARGIRFLTLTAVCDALDCQPDLLRITSPHIDVMPEGRPPGWTAGRLSLT
ncbi:helix-turn-helix domain-containing protein [Actinopolymorpha pittospori]|uniref:helix-turn-helix domain-containing protein n=1 Tax=Actinopolymorpha pittospori TaxID=648752 RepID=UPI0017894F95